VCLDDLFFFELARNDLLDLVFEAKRDLGDFFGVDGWSWQPFATGGRKDWSILVGVLQVEL
jgi:hypothetical protein